MAFLRSILVASAVASAAAFAPGAAVLPRAAKAGAAGLCMSAGTGKPKTVAAFRAGNQGRSNVPTDPSSIDLDIVMGTKDRKDTVGGVDTTYQKPPSSFFSFAAPAKRVVAPKAAPKPVVRAAPKAAPRAAPKPVARVVAKPAPRAAAPAPRAAPSRPAPRAAAKPAPRVAAKPAPAAKPAGGGLFSIFGGAKPADSAKPAAKPAPKAPVRAAAAPVQRGALRGTMRIGK